MRIEITITQSQQSRLSLIASITVHLGDLVAALLSS